MILKSIKLKNFGIHRDFEYEFKLGVTAIVGGNGKGKSTLIESISFLFTGQVAHDTKEEVITVGQASGYVAGEFILNDKLGYIERHLDSSKVLLRYDGVEKKKSGEVKELWDKLLNINPEIFNKLIIAGQGEIPLLFSGDKATRLSIFQKIFLVPNVSKVREIIWEDYIKKLPPVYNVEDTLEIKSQLTDKTAELKEQQKLHNVYREVQERDWQVLETKSQELSRLQQDISEKAKLGESIAVVQTDRLKLVTKLEALRKEQAEAPFQADQLKEMIREMGVQKVLKMQKDRLLVQIDDDNVKLASIRFTKEDQISLSSTTTALTDIASEISAWQMMVVELKAKAKIHAQLKGTEAVCPTCGQDVKDIAKLVAKLQEEIATYTANIAKHNVSKEAYTKAITKLETKKSASKETEQAIQLKTAELAKFENVSFDEEQFELLKQVLVKLESLSSELASLTSSISLLDVALNGKIERFNQLPEVVDIAVIDAEIAAIKKSQEEISLKLVAKYRTFTALKVLDSELTTLNNKLTQAEHYKAQNLKREKLYNLLISLYDTFHPNIFSKKVIQKYSNVVSEYLQNNLTRFNIPYLAAVNDEFNVEVLNRDGYKLPKVSGGQKVIIGLCLRLALLQIFAQNFDFMIVDEGTNSLDAANQEAYFQLVKELNSTQLKQVILVDHNEKLTQYVDNFLNLNS